MGNVFHDALKYFSDKIEASEYDWFHVPEEKRTVWMEEALEHALQICAEKGLGEEATDGAYEADRAADSLGIDGTASER